ncbi:hypothetical protein SEMRO_3887_G351710.1 [Seminavis robusta]|uniref:Uncharacterized protein n=1 Tax=Seminavis robusta TaxID=568900 RepID=A0A9N8I1M0_9STRA|nr:hypothetical protein SEMRO_3887_G351710.1 [Seminavis robusta]|eukprot:Sro3887_g351710.1 n/a (382) ;mRNA; f:1003-2229
MAKIGIDAEYECDNSLPPEGGLELEVKVFLLKLLDERGGIKAPNRKNKLVAKLCDDYPSQLGCRSSVRRYRTVNLVDRWKRNHDFEATRANIIAEFNKLDLQCPNPEPDDGSPPEDSVIDLPETKPKPQKVKSSAAPTKKKKSNKPTPDSTMSASKFGSPIKLLRAQIKTDDEEDDDLEQYFDFDLVNEDNHGDYLATMSTEERVGKMQASAIVVCRPNVAPEDVKHFTASFTKDCISIEGPSKDSGFLDGAEGKDGWLPKLEKTKTRFEAVKLTTTLMSLVTKLNKKQRPKTTHISVKDLGITVSNDYFSKGAAKGKLKLLPLPYKVIRTGKAGVKEEITRVFLVWRAFIIGTLCEVEAEAKTKTKGDQDLLDEMLALTG